MNRMVCTKFWTDSKVKQLSLTEKAVFLYLITNPHTHLCGLYYLPLSLATEEIGVPIKWPAILKRFADLELAYYDDEQRLVWVCKMFGYQGRGENIYKSVAKHLQSFHPSFLINSFIDLYIPIKSLIPKGFIKGVHKGDSNPMRRGSVTITDSSTSSSSEFNQESGQEIEIKTDTDKADFEAFWNAYPRKTGKKKAYDAWHAAKDRPALPVILAKIVELSKTDQWMKDDGKFIPHPSTWLNQGRWDDQPIQPQPKKRIILT